MAAKKSPLREQRPTTGIKITVDPSLNVFPKGPIYYCPVPIPREVVALIEQPDGTVAEVPVRIVR